MRLVQTVGYLAHREIDPTFIVIKMKTNSDASKTLYLGLDVHKAKIVITILESHRETVPRHYGTIANLTRPRRSYATFPVLEFSTLSHHKIIMSLNFQLFQKRSS